MNVGELLSVFGSVVVILGSTLNAAGQIQQAQAESPQAELIRNGSFEQELPGIHPLIPDFWVEVFETNQDRMALIDDYQKAHWGRRCIQLYGAGSKGISMHAFGYPIELVPGQTYTVRVWAKAVNNAQATLFVEPGHGKVQLTGKWQEYRFTHVHPKDAKPALGLTLRLAGGPALIDDVSMAVKGKEPPPPPEVLADRASLAKAPVDWTWRQVAGEPKWQERIVVQLSELMNRRARNYRVELPLRRILPGVRFDFISKRTVKVVDASKPAGKSVPFVFVKTRTNRIRAEGRTGWDRLVFLAHCPPRTTKTYFIYVAERIADGRTVNWPTSITANWRKCSYRYRLETRVSKPQKRMEVTAGIEGARLNLLATNETAQSAKAELIAPDGKQQITLTLSPSKGHRRSWTLDAGFQMPEDAAEGIWQASVQFTDASGQSENATSAFVWGSALWWGPNVKKIFRSDPPVYGASTVQLASARNEREAFQIVVAGSEGLTGVALSAIDLVHENGKARIPSSNFKFERVVELYLPSPMIGPGSWIGGFGAFAYPHRGGWHPDPLLPWVKQDIPPGGQKVAWTTLTVPKDVPAGLYRGKIIATDATGKKLQIPVELTVFDFSLPDRLTFTPVLGADVGSRNRQLALPVAALFGRRGVSPFYYSQNNGPYPAPWRYHPETRTADIDFSEFDKNARFLIEDIGIKYLFIGSEYHPGGKKFRAIYDGGRNLKTEHRAANDTADARAMWQAWSQAMGAHLKQKGWLEHAYVYVTDEPDAKLLPVIEEISKILKARYPIRTFVACGGSAGDAMGPWKSYLDYIDAFSGRADEANRRKMIEKGHQYWGVYNRAWFVGTPLATQRMIGFDSFVDNVPAYFHWSLSDLRHNRWKINPRRIKYMGAVAGCPAGTFLKYFEPCGMGNAIYFWPEDEPVPPGKLKPVASSIRLESLREGEEDYEYIEILKNAAATLPRDSSVRKRYHQLRNRLAMMVKKWNVGGSWTHALTQWGLFVVPPEELYEFRRQLGQTIEAALRNKRAN